MAARRFDQPPREQALGKPLALALLMHALLLAMLALGTHWRSSEPPAIEAELWGTVPDFAPPRAVPPPAPPEAKPEVKAEPKAPEEKEPEIRIEKKKDEPQKEAPPPAPKPQAETRPETKPQRDPVDELRRQIEAERAKKFGTAPQSASPNQRVSGTAPRGSRFSTVSTGRVKDNLNFPESPSDKPAVVKVRLGPDGTVLDVQFIQSSGNPAKDAAIERAIQRTGRFPPEAAGQAYEYVEMEFKPSPG
jgi:colicin import membrane protein